MNPAAIQTTVWSHARIFVETLLKRMRPNIIMGMCFAVISSSGRMAHQTVIFTGEAKLPVRIMSQRSKIILHALHIILGIMSMGLQ